MIEHLSSHEFSGNARKALDDGELRGALDKATRLFDERRRGAVDGMPAWEELRERAREIKAHALAHLDEYLEAFVERAEAAGAQVHWARDGREACRIVAELAQSRGAKRLVKSKSMTTEEIDLNGALERAGCEPIETDLGEYIIQLAGETPSHIIVPAIHKTKRQIAELFVEKLDIGLTEDEAELTAVARRVLREHFARADIGISGVNFGIAETGSILILENEGNARMTTSLPRAHVAVMGIEKVIPRFEDLEVFLRLLPRSGTGQHLTSYQSILTGVDPNGEGPEEVHILLLDNGRTGLLGEDVTRQSLACIRCGACLNACPVYKQIGGHAYGSVYPGPIGAVITPQLAGIQHARELPFASSLCGACRDVCPVKIDLPQLLLHLRARVQSEPAATAAAEEGAASPSFASGLHAVGERVAFRMWAWAMAGPRRYALSARVLRFLLGGSRGPVRKLPGPLSAWLSTRDFRSPAAKTFRELARRPGGPLE